MGPWSITTRAWSGTGFDPFYDHLLADRPRSKDGAVVGVYRLLRDDQAAAAGQFYSEG